MVRNVKYQVTYLMCLGEWIAEHAQRIVKGQIYMWVAY